MRCRRFSRVAKIFIEIVDASVIDEPSAGVENRRLWRNLRLTLFHQNMLRVAKRRKGVAEFTIVLANGVGRFLLVRINQKECRVVAMLRAELQNSRNEEAGKETKGLRLFTHGVQREWGNVTAGENRCPINYFTGSRAHKSE